MEELIIDNCAWGNLDDFNISKSDLARLGYRILTITDVISELNKTIDTDRKTSLLNKVDEFSDSKPLAYFGFDKDPNADGFGSINNLEAGGDFATVADIEIIAKYAHLSRGSMTDSALIARCKARKAVLLTRDKSLYNKSKVEHFKAVYMKNREQVLKELAWLVSSQS